MAEAPGALLGPRALEQLQKTVRETARRMRNEGPHRARWHGKPLSEARPIEGLVVACVGGGWWEIELAEWDSEPDEAGSSGSQVDDSEECDPCTLAGLEPDPDSPCTSREVTINHRRPQGLGVVVYAHDTRRIPLKIGGHVRMLKTHVSSKGEQLYAVISGEYRLLAIANPDYECCDGEVIQTGCSYYLVEGVECPGWVKDCPS